MGKRRFAATGIAEYCHSLHADQRCGVEGAGMRSMTWTEQRYCSVLPWNRGLAGLSLNGTTCLNDFFGKKDSGLLVSVDADYNGLE